jgi:hypothetical protein
MLPFSAIALVAFGLYVYMRGFQISEAFILLSLITLPHVLVMHRLYHQPTTSKLLNQIHSKAVSFIVKQVHSQKIFFC